MRFWGPKGFIVSFVTCSVGTLVLNNRKCLPWSASYLHLNQSSGSRTCAHVRRPDCPSSWCALQANLESSAPYWLLEAPDLVKGTLTDWPVLFSVALEPCQPSWPVLALAPSSFGVGALAVSCSVEELRTSLGPCCLRLWLPLLWAGGWCSKLVVPF